ncbi:MAG: PPC domain-containing DNA-binding protein [Syntrophales bacterium]
MAVVIKVKHKEKIMGRLRHGADLLGELSEICKKEKIQLGRLEAIGAVQKACIGFYNQEKREYQFITIDQPLEITNLTGNISIKDGNPIVHAHLTLSDSSGKAYGGHLAPGTIVFACECMIESFDGSLLERGFDQETGLPLWTVQE